MRSQCCAQSPQWFVFLTGAPCILHSLLLLWTAQRSAERPNIIVLVRGEYKGSACDKKILLLRKLFPSKYEIFHITHVRS